MKNQYQDTNKAWHFVNIIMDILYILSIYLALEGTRIIV